jgi:hypothetical protein
MRDFYPFWDILAPRSTGKFPSLCCASNDDAHRGIDMLQVSFRLKFAMRRDDDANVHVGYCPALKLYSQGADKMEAKAAIVSAAKLFIVRCYEKDILHTVLRDRGMTRASAEQVKKISTANGPDEFISVGDFTDHFYEEVPIQLLAAKEAATLCPQ